MWIDHWLVDRARFVVPGICARDTEGSSPMYSWDRSDSGARRSPVGSDAEAP